jgi:putative ABC transport system permease protein
MAFFSDICSALRILSRSKAYALTSVAVLALGIGVNVAIFSVVDSVVLSPLPYPNASRLVFVWQRLAVLTDPILSRSLVYHKNYLELQHQNTVFDEMAAFGHKQLNDTSLDHPQRVSVGFASASLFPMLGVHAQIGRVLMRGDETAGSNRVAMISDEFFARRFQRNSRVLGESLNLDGDVYSVIGVLPAQFHLPATREGLDQIKADVWVPLTRFWAKFKDEPAAPVFVAARLKRGTSLSQARAEMSVVGERLAKADPELNKPWTMSVFPFAVEDAAPTLHRALWVLLATVGFLLLIACANLANLTLARATQRSREIAVRLALGATRSRIVRQLLYESLLISFAGALMGLLLGNWCIRLVLALKPPDIQRPELIGLNLTVFAFAAGWSVLTALLLGLAPALSVSRADLNTTLKSGGGWGGSAVRLRSRQFLIAAEVGLALMLLAGSGLMIRSFRELTATGVGFRTEHLVTADIDLPARDFPNGASQARFFGGLLDRIRAIPSISSAGVVDNLPLHQVSMRQFMIVGRPEPPRESFPVFDTARVSLDYFGVLGLRLLGGRWFTNADFASAEGNQDSVALVNRSLARQVFGTESPLGHRLLDGDKSRSHEIIGVISDYRAMGVENPQRPEVFFPSVEMASASLVARTSGTLDQLTKQIQSAIWSLDGGIPQTKVSTVDSYLDEWQSQRRFNTLLLGIFAGLALLLAMIGIYGVLSNLVTSRVREIGIRMAIGAAPAEIARLLLRQSFVPISIGLAAGLGGALALGKFVQALLFHVSASDPLTLIFAVAAIVIVSPLALFVPVRRATSVDCTVALREE